MADKDLSQVFGDSGVSSFGDLKKVASDETESAPSQHSEPLDVDPEDIEADLEDFLEEDDVDLPVSPTGVEDAFGQTSYILPEVIRAVAAQRKRKNKTNADLLMDALDYYAARGQLSKLVQRRHTGPRRPKGSLFPDRRVKSKATSDGKGRKLWTFQVTKDEEAIMQKLADDHGANSLSELVSVVMESRYKPKL